MNRQPDRKKENRVSRVIVKKPKLFKNLPTPTDSCNVNGECDGSCERLAGR